MFNFVKAGYYIQKKIITAAAGFPEISKAAAVQNKKLTENYGIW